MFEPPQFLLVNNIVVDRLNVLVSLWLYAHNWRKADWLAEIGMFLVLFIRLVPAFECFIVISARWSQLRRISILVTRAFALSIAFEPHCRVVDKAVTTVAIIGGTPLCLQRYGLQFVINSFVFIENSVFQKVQGWGKLIDEMEAVSLCVVPTFWRIYSIALHLPVVLIGFILIESQ